MSVSIQTVEFERREAHLSELDEGPPFKVHGVALGSGDVTVGQSGIKKLWPGGELSLAASTLEGRNLVVDHDNDSHGVVGNVTKAGFKEDTGVIYEAELFDEDLAQKINNGLLEVSIRGHHIDVEAMDTHEETGAKIVEGIEFENLSIVPTGAAPSNSIEMGEADELSVAELAEFTEDLERYEELQEIEPGMWVQWGENRGITIGQVEDGEVEVDLYEESDGKWRSTEETTMVSTDSLSEWDVDEEEEIGEVQDEDESDEEEEDGGNDEEESAEIPPRLFFDSEEAAMEFVEGEDGLTGVHEMDEGWLPGDTHDEFLEWWDNQSSQSKHKDEEEMRVEGEEEEITTDADKRELKDQSPERYPEGGDEEASADEGDTSDVEQLQNYEMHSVDFSGTTESEWSSPDLEDFDTDDLSEIDNHFIISSSGFPPENFGDLKLPVVEPNGDLNLNALQAVKGGRGVSAVEGLDSGMEEDIVDMVNSLANDEYDKSWGEDEEASDGGEPDEEEAAGQRPRTVDDTGNEPGVGQDGGPVGVSLELINKYLRHEGKHERDTVDNMLSWLFGNNDLPTETVDDFRTAANASLDQTAGTDTFSGLTVEQFRDWLLTHGDGSQGQRESDGGRPSTIPVPVHVLTGDDLRQGGKSEESELDNITKVTQIMTEDIEEELAELDEPVAVEKSDLEDLQEKADQFEDMNSSLEDLRERTEILDSVDREQVEELKEGDEPVVIESTRYAALQDEAEQVKTVYAAALAEAYDVFDAEELTDRFSIEELREKYEENIGDPEEELAAEPRSGDVDEEELEEQAEAEEEEELSDEEEEAEEKRAELRELILSDD